MKLLDFTLIGILAGSIPLARAGEPATQPALTTPPPQATAAADEAEDAALDCASDGCSSADDGLLFRLRTRGKREPLPGEPGETPADGLQRDRRVSVEMEQPGTAVATGRFSIALPDGGVIWATEDPAIGQPELSVSAPTMLPFDGHAITRPVQFYVRSNYSAFVQRYELLVYRGDDVDLIDPVARVPMDVGNVASTDWDGALPQGRPFRAGDSLVYVLRAYNAEGDFDETWPRTMQLVKPEEAERGDRLLRDSTESRLGTALSVEEAQRQSLVEGAFSGNQLRQQNIPVYGSRVRIQGRDLPHDRGLLINGESYPVDLESKFAAEFLVPVGHHRFELALQQSGAGGEGATAPYALDVDVSGRYFFGVGLADVTFSGNNVGGSVEPLQVDGRYDDDVISDGRLAFYGKAKFKGKYLVTAQADTTERDLEHLFDGFFEADPQDVFRRLDPDLYYPVYGDDSTTWRDVDTMGRFYVRVDWDKSQALWGNYATGFTGTEYAQYVRSLYGAAIDWRSRGANRWGDAKTELRAFASEANSAPGHSEFIGTGGSLYYLRHTDLLPGSDAVVLEVRDASTGRVERRVTLQRGTDYEIDELQGRILLTRPLAQITRENLPTLTRDRPLDGFEQRLLVDYEWIPNGFAADDTSAGVRGRQWLGDHVGVGATYVREERAGDDYTLAGGDVTLQAGKGTYLKAEYTRSESFSAPVYFSDNGGLSFSRINPVGPREGDAKAVEARANFRELGWTTQDWSAGSWWREVGSGFSVSRFDTGEDVTEYGTEVLGRFSEDFGIYARYSRAERGDDALTQAQLTGEWRLGGDDTLSAEIRRVQEDDSGAAAAGVLAAVKYQHRFGSTLDVYGIGQVTLDDDGGRYEDNNALTVGGKYLFGELSSVGLEATTGDRGNAVTAEAEYRLTPEHSFYGSYTLSTDSTDYDPLFNPAGQDGWTLGQRWRLSDQVNVFNESQYLKEQGESGLAHTFGLDFYPAHGWNTGFTLQSGELTNVDGGLVERKAVSVHGGITRTSTDWQSKLEWREDTGAEQRSQWVSSNRLVHRFNDSWRMAARLNYADTDDALDAAAGARFIEGNAGFAWRPWNSQRWGVFGRYTYLYDLSTLGQVGGADYDQKTRVLSFEGVYKLDVNWEFAARVARRDGDVRYGRGAGAWADSGTSFASGQVRYDLPREWHALAEYRWLDVDDGGTRSGYLLGLDRDIGENMRLGVGYNFTEFSDDLTDFDYDHRGWFLNMVGSY